MSGSVYESGRILNEYLLFHYGQSEEVLPYAFGPREALGFAVRTVSECLDVNALPENARALDLGCAVGRSSFELARHCREVLGIDYSAVFIRAAQRIQRDGSLEYQRKITGDIVEPAVVRIPPDIERGRVRFEVGDAHEAPADCKPYEVVHAANLLCRMAEPRKLLKRLPALVKAGGQLILATPNTWLEEFTPREHWLGATPDTGDPLAVLKAELGGAFEFVATRDLPFLIREHARKFQWSVSQASLWRRRPL